MDVLFFVLFCLRITGNIEHIDCSSLNVAVFTNHIPKGTPSDRLDLSSSERTGLVPMRKEKSISVL